MKRLIFLALLISLSACEFYYMDPVYDNRDRITGRYEMDEYSATWNEYTRYTIWIDRSTRNATDIWIDNLYDVNIRVRATMSFDRITIPRQTVNGFDVEGVGTVYGNRISLTYRIRNIHRNTRTDFLDATAFRR